MLVKKVLFTTAITFCISTPIYADYAYCKVFDRDKNGGTFHYSTVFSTSKTDATLDILASPFADEYNTYPGNGATCRTYFKSLKKGSDARRADMENEGRWAKVILTDWRP